MIGFDRENAFIQSLRKSLAGFSRERFALRTDSDLAQLAAIRAGYGLGICQVRLAERDPALVRVMTGEISLKLDTWVAMHEDLRESPRCRVAFTALAQGLQRYVTGAR